LRKIISWVIIFFSCFILIFFSQEKDDTILEKVAVVNVEVPVRVFYKGKPVKDLKRLDFKIYEDRKLQNINAFFQVRKKINIQSFKLTADKKEKKIFPPRYFVLIFNLIDYNRNLEKGLEYTFNKILKENDQLLVMINKKIKFYNNLIQKKIIQREIKNLLQEQGKISREKMNTLFNQIEKQIRELKFLLESRININISTDVFIKQFLNKYYYTWKYFKNEYLVPDIDKFYYFSKHLEKIKKEKWVINFYQPPLFPQIKLTSETLKGVIERLKTREFHNMYFSLQAETEFPADELSKLFYKVNATFHLILIPIRMYIPHEDMEFKSVSTALENCFREITKRTGGTVVSSTDLVTALDTISEKEDIYYMLTYRPENPKKIGKIKVAVVGKKYNYKVRYDKNIRADYIKDYLERKKAENPEIKIKQISFRDSKLSLLITDFLLKKEKKESFGKVNIRIRIENTKGEIIYEKDKKLKPINKTASIQIDFKWLKLGRYYILVDVLDELTGESYPDYIQTEISETRSKIKRVEFKEEVIKPEKESVEDDFLKNIELEKYLKGAAEYCERLKQRAFHFICKEKVSIIIKELNLKAKYTHWKGAPRSKFWNIRQHTESYLFDYQLINNKGQITEQRRLISRNSINDKKFSVKNMVSSFLSEKAIFGPHTMLSKKRQNKFKYEILKTKRNKNQRIVVIKVIPKKEEEVFFSSGEVWIDTENFSVRKIRVVPRYIEGYEKLIQKRI
jgi:hypothetical protein